MSAPEYQSVPVTILDWRETRDLLPEQKLIFAYLWFARESSWCGIYLLPIEATAARLSLTARSLEDALGEFRRRGLIDMDDETGEIYIERWLYCRYNYTGTKWENMWESAMAAVRSPRLWEKANKAKSLIKSKAHDKNGNRNRNRNRNIVAAPPTTHGSAAEGGATTTKKEKKQKSKWPTHVGGIMCWSPDDMALAEGVTKKFGDDAIANAVAELVGGGEKPLPARVAHILAPRPILPPGWDASEKSICAAAAILGLKARAGELMPEFKARIWEAARAAARN